MGRKKQKQKQNFWSLNQREPYDQDEAQMQHEATGFHSDVVKEKQKKKKEKEKKKNDAENYDAESKQLQQSWSGPPDDILRLILTRLNWVDRVRFCLVSKNFPSFLHQIPCRPADKLPWLFYTSSKGTWAGGSRCKLCEPFSGRTYSVRIMDQKVKRCLSDVAPFASSHGWVLLSQNEGWIDRKFHNFYLYRPYNKRFVKLPELEVCRDFVIGRATISVDQTSLVTVFFACLDKKTRRTINIWIHHTGATRWKNFKFRIPISAEKLGRLEDALYADGLVYCVFNGGRNIVIFDAVLQDWEFFSNYSPLHYDYFLHKYYTIFNGELLMFYTYTDEDKPGLGLWNYSWRFDKSLKQWVQQESLGDLALFVGYLSIFPIKAVGELSCYANTVHILQGTESISVGTGEVKKSELYHVSNGSLHWRSYCWIDPPDLAQN